ncbi:MAG: stalk domain-containing protein, partial [Clostridia bacterium]|nr:stalk domain-containing protein [Clostridia bacterium]
LCLYLGRNNFIYATETKVDLNDSGSLYALIEDGVCTIKGHGEFNKAAYEKISGEIPNVDIKELIFRGDSSKITFPKDSSGLFSGVDELSYLETFVCDDNSNVVTNNVTNFSNMFNSLSYLKDIDVSGFTTTKAIDMSEMFDFCGSIEVLNLSSFSTGKVENFDAMFGAMISLEELVISNFSFDSIAADHPFDESDFIDGANNIKVIDLRYVDFSDIDDTDFFSGLSELERIYVPAKIDGSKVFMLPDDFYVFDKTGYLGTKDNVATTSVLLSSEGEYNDTKKHVYYLDINKPDSVRKLVSISASKTKTEYVVGETIGTSDIKVYARYDNGTKKQVTNYTTKIENGDTIKISYQEDGITKGESIHITFIQPKVVLSSITVTKDKKDYDDTSSITWEDLKVTANYSDGTKKSIPYNDTNLKIEKVEDDIYNIKYTDPDDTSVTKTVEMILNIKGVDTLRYIDARKQEDEYDTYKDVDLDDITCYAYYTKSGKVKLEEIDEEEYKKTTDDRKDGFCVFYDPDDEEDYITVKYKHNGIEFKDTISLDIDEDDDDEDDNRYLKSIVAYKDKKEYYSDEKVDYDDIYIKVNYYSSSKKSKTVYYTDDDKNMKVSINSAKTKITVKYTYNGETCTDTITIKQLDGNNPSNTVVVQGNKQIVLYIGNRTCYINGITKTLDAAPEIKNDRTYLPIRHVVEALGGQVYWSSTNPNTVKIYKDNVDIILTIGARYASVNGVTHILDDAPYTKNDRTYMPVRFISEQLGAIVDWSASNPYQVVVRNR